MKKSHKLTINQPTKDKPMNIKHSHITKNTGLNVNWTI